MRVSKGVSPFTLQLVCTASASTGPSIAWRVYKPKRQVWDNVTNDEEYGVHIENHNVSSCVLTSTLTITNYRKLGFFGSVFTCLAYCSSNKTFESANWTVEGRHTHSWYPFPMHSFCKCGGGGYLYDTAQKRKVF